MQREEPKRGSIHDATSWPLTVAGGQPSWSLHSDLVDLSISRTGAMLAPVRFALPQGFADPYALAPWADEPPLEGVPPMLAALRGDWFCSTFGSNAEAWNGVQLPVHGDTANAEWTPIARADNASVSWLSVATDLSLTGGRCVGTTALRTGHRIVYQVHDLSDLSTPINPGHHAMLRFPATSASGSLSFSRHRVARSYPGKMDGPQSDTVSMIASDVELRDLTRAPTVEEGAVTDLTQFPARPGYDDVVIICADQSLDFAWSAVTFSDEGYVWFAIRDPRHFASTMLWFSNGGRKISPFSGRHLNRMGIEDITAFFHDGIAASARANMLNRYGIPTMLSPDDAGRLSLSYIQGVAPVPASFDRLAEIIRCPDGETVRLIADNGCEVVTPCVLEFLQDRRALGIDLPRA